jgi:hypothetical protein
MSEIHEFINEVAAISQNGQPEAAQKELVGQAFARWVEETHETYSREEYPNALVRGWVAELRFDLKTEVNRAHPGRFGILIDHAHGLVAEWLRQH